MCGNGLAPAATEPIVASSPSSLIHPKLLLVLPLAMKPLLVPTGRRFHQSLLVVLVQSSRTSTSSDTVTKTCCTTWPATFWAQFYGPECFATKLVLGWKNGTDTVLLCLYLFIWLKMPGFYSVAKLKRKLAEDVPWAVGTATDFGQTKGASVGVARPGGGKRSKHHCFCWISSHIHPAQFSNEHQQFCWKMSFAKICECEKPFLSLVCLPFTFRLDRIDACLVHLVFLVMLCGFHLLKINHQHQILCRPQHDNNKIYTSLAPLIGRQGAKFCRQRRGFSPSLT